MSNSFILVRDNDGHWYVIPKEKEQDFYNFFEDPEYPYKDMPVWAERTGGSPSLVEFSNYTIN